METNITPEILNRIHAEAANRFIDDSLEFEQMSELERLRFEEGARYGYELRVKEEQGKSMGLFPVMKWEGQIEN